MRGDKEIRNIALRVSIALVAGMFSIVPVVHGAPVLNKVVSGGAKVDQTTTANVTDITSSSTNNVIDWHDFSVANGETVQFDGGKTTGNVHNYMNVVSGANTSTINGAIKGGNEVYIINPNGVIFGKGSSVDVGSLYATTRADAVKTGTNGAVDFNATKTNIIKAGASATGAATDIVNMGNISATNVVLEGENIRLLNSADINATNVTLRADDGYIHVGSSDGKGGAGYVSQKLTSSGSSQPTAVEKYMLVDNSNWSSTLGKNAANISGNYMLAEDIDLKNGAMSTVTGTFSGKIDGNFYAVKRAKGTSGLFAATNNATIENMGVKDGNFTASNGDIGAFITDAVDTTLINVYNDNSNITKAGNYSAGLVAYADHVTIKSSYSTGSIKTSKGKTEGAGLVGCVQNVSGSSSTNTVTDSYSTGDTFNGLLSNGDGNATITFERTISRGTNFHDNYTGATINNSVVSGSTSYRTSDSTGNESANAISGTLDLTQLTNLTSGGSTKPLWNTATATNISDTGGLAHDNQGNYLTDSNGKVFRPTWRIYEGKAAPILTAFTQGIKTNTYNYAYYTSTGKDTNALSYNNYNNGGKDMTAYTYTPVTPATTPATYVNDGLVYNGRTLKIVDGNGDALTAVDTSALFATQGISTIDPAHVQMDTAGRKDATSYNATTKKSGNIAFIYSDQNGYDLVGNNIAIAPRRVTISDDFTGKMIVKEYDGQNTDASSYVSKLFSGSSVSSTGFLQEDIDNKTVGVELVGATAGSTPSAVFTDSTGTTPDANVGTNKKVVINGKLIMSNGQGTGTPYSGSNYIVIDKNGAATTAVTLNNSKIDAVIYQRTLTVDYTGNPITKEYDKTGTVMEKNASGQYVTRSFSTSDFTLTPDTLAMSEGVALAGTISNNGYEDSTGLYNVGSYGVTFSGISLNTAGKNYVLKDGNGVVYSANPIITATQTGVGTYNITTTSAVTTGTLKTTGDITLRKLDNTGYQWFYKTNNVSSTPQNASKEYDYKYDFEAPTVVPKDSSGKPVWYVTNAGNATGGLLPGDSIDLQINSAEFWTTDGKTTGQHTRDAGTAKGVQYKVTVTGNSVGNYTLDGTNALTSGGTADVYGVGTITPRTIYLVNGIAADKEYDGDANVYDNPASTTRSATFDLSTKYLEYDTNKGTAHQLIAADGSSIEIKGAYQITGSEARDQDVNYGVNATTGVNGALAKNIQYTATIKNGNGNYVFANGTPVTNDPNSAIYTGSGTINQKQLGKLAFADVSKTYDSYNNVTDTVNTTTGPLYTNDKIQLGFVNAGNTGLITGEQLKDVFYVDNSGYLDYTGAPSTITKLTGTYGDYDAATGAFTPNANATLNSQPGAHVANTTTKVEYTGLNDLMKNHNYKLDSTQGNTIYGDGVINRYLIDDASKINLSMDASKFITQEYNGSADISKTDAINYLSNPGNPSATITGLPNTSGLSLTVSGASFASEHSKNNAKQDVYYYVTPNATGNYDVDPSIKIQNGQPYAGDVKLTLSNAGIITQKHITADSTMLADSNLTKPYDATDNVLKTGDKLIDITSQILPVDTGVTNAITANYVTNAAGTTGDVNASLTNQDKFVKYTLAINDANNNNDYFITANSGDKYSVDASGNVSKINDAGNGNITSVTNWTTDFTVAKNGTINKRVLVINFDPVQKTYDGGADVTNKTTADTIRPHITNDIAGDKVALNIVGIGGAATGVTATYVDPISLKDDANASTTTKKVKYINLNAALTSTDPNKAALISRNYEFANNGVAYGTGQIDKATISMNDLRLYVGNITKTYDGSADFTNFAGTFGEYGYVDLGNGVNNPRFTYTINGAEYISKGTGTSLAGAGTGKDVVYHLANITLGSNNYQWSTGSGPIASYDFSSSASNSSSNAINIYTGTNLTTPGTGEVTKKDVYAKINTPFVTKTYNASDDVRINGAVPANIDTLVTINGLVNTATNTSTNTSTVNYTNQDRGTNKDVDYNLSISDGENYNILYDSTDVNAANYTMGYVGNTNVINKVTTHNNEIKAKDLYVTFDKVTKTYDGTTDVPTNATLGAGRYVNPNFNGGLEGSDALTITVGNGTEYNSPNVPDASYITYKNIVVTGANGTNENNYNIIWQNKDGTTGSASAVTGDGQIDKLVLTTAPNITRTSNPVTKEYAGVNNAKVAYDDDEDLTKVKNGYLQSAQVMINGQQQQIPFDLTAATYDNTDGSITGGTPRGVTFTVALNSANIDFSQVSVPGTNGVFTINDTGTITPRKLYVSVDRNVSKVYDGTLDVKDNNPDTILKINNANKIVAGEKVYIDSTALNGQYKYKDSDIVTSGNNLVNRVTYQTTLGGTEAGNYELHDYANMNTPANDNIITQIEGNGEIKQRQVTINMLNGKVDDKKYDGSYDATTAPNYTTNGRFSLEKALPGSNTGIISQEVNAIGLDENAVTAVYDHGGHVQRAANGAVINDTITFSNFALENINNANSALYPVSNYTLTPQSFTGSGRILPRKVAVDIAATPTKTYDGKTDVGVTDAGVDNKNLSVDTTNVLPNDRINLLVKADFVGSDGTPDAHVTAAGTKGYRYNITMDNDDYALVNGGNRSFSTNNDGKTAVITGSDGTITPRILTIASISPVSKVYDGTDTVANASQYIHVNPANVVAGEENKLGLESITGRYQPKTVGSTTYLGSDAGTSETDSPNSLILHDVVYTLALNNPDYVFATGTNNVGKGTISRRGLNIVANPASINMGDSLPSSFSGSVQGLLAGDLGLAGRFVFGPDGQVNTSVAGDYGIYGWYRGNKAGSLGLNYTFDQASANDTALTVNFINRTDNPDTKITPTPDIYHKISKDMHSGFGDNDIAAIEYQDKNGTVIGTITINSGEVNGKGIVSGNDELNIGNADLSKIGIAGGDIVNMEGADAAGIANIELTGDGSTVNLEVFALDEVDQNLSNKANSVAEITNTETNANAVAQIELLDEKRVITDEEDDKIEKQEKEGKIAIKSSNEQNEDEIELDVEGKGVNIA